MIIFTVGNIFFGADPDNKRKNIFAYTVWRFFAIHIYNYIKNTWAKLDSLMKDFVKQIPQLKNDLHPVEYAAMLHAIFVNIHPFIDGNGRVARLLMNLALLQSGYNITIIPPVVRADYIRALQDSNKNNFKPFVNFISEMVLESQKEYWKIIRKLIN